jgi:hypothetical protein
MPTLSSGAYNYSPHLNTITVTMVPNLVENTHPAGPGWPQAAVTTAGPISLETFHQPAPAITGGSSYAGSSSCMPGD